jgi:hypothetical protein
VKLAGKDADGVVLVSDPQEVTAKAWAGEEWTAPMRAARVRIVEGPETQQTREYLRKGIEQCKAIIIVNQAAVRDLEVDCTQAAIEVLTRALGRNIYVAPAAGGADVQPDFTVELNVTVSSGTKTGTFTRAEVKLRVLDTGGREVAQVSGVGSRRVPFPATSAQVTPALQDAADDLEKQIGNGTLGSAIVTGQIADRSPIGDGGKSPEPAAATGSRSVMTK